LKDIEQVVNYRAFYFNPKTGKTSDPIEVIPDQSHEWRPPLAPLLQDWVLVMEACSFDVS